MYRRTMYYGRRGVVITAMAGVDLALWDLKGKLFNQPVVAPAGRASSRPHPGVCVDPVRPGRIRNREIAQRWREAGYGAIKFGWEPMGESEALDIELVRGGREGIGGENTLLIDAGCVWDARTALRRAEAFNDYGIGWLEEPLEQDDIDGYVWLRDRSPVLIAAGEGELPAGPPSGPGSTGMRWTSTRSTWRETDSPKRPIFGSAWKRSAPASATTATRPPSAWRPACTGSAPARAPSFSRIASRIRPLRHELTHEKLQAADGRIAVPDGPGLGITLDERFVERFLVSESGR